jgi:HlyD family secretion protein
VIDRGLVQQDIVDEGRTRIHDVFVISAPVAGRLERIVLKAGDAVTRGQVVATIAPADPALLDTRVAAESQATIAAAQAAQRAAEAAADLAQRDQSRVARLAAQGFASQAALDSANMALRSARANAAARRADVARAQAAAGLSGARARVATTVRAPSSGRVLRLLQESEAVIGAGTPLIEVGDPRDMEVVAEFLSQDVAQMPAGAAAWIENWGGGEPIPARVERVEPYAHTKISALGVEEQRVNVVLRLVRPEAAPILGHEFRVDVRVVLAQANNALRVPVDALVRNGEGWEVFRVERGRARVRAVKTGLGGDRYRVIESGLLPGDKVILFPSDAVKDGESVRIASGRKDQK